MSDPVNRPRLSPRNPLPTLLFALVLVPVPPSVRAETPKLVFTVPGVGAHASCVMVPGRLFSLPEKLDLTKRAGSAGPPKHNVLDPRYLIGRLHAADLAADRERFVAFFMPGEHAKWRAALRKDPRFLAKNRRDAMSVEKFLINGWADYLHYTVVLTTRHERAKRHRRAYVFTSTPETGWRRVSGPPGDATLKVIFTAWRTGMVTMIPTDVILTAQPRCD